MALCRMLLVSVVVWCVMIRIIRSEWPIPVAQLDNVCLAGLNHKLQPGPEDSLHHQCTPWKERSCCTTEISTNLHQNQTWYNFNWNHCGGENQLSAKCKEHFIQDLCFYECSPNVGPWLVQVDMKIRNTTFKSVPLCAADCDKWFQDCFNDFTCLENWGKDFNWSSGTNQCPQPAGVAACQSFGEIFDDAEAFCEKIWDGSFAYTKDAPCMTLWPNIVDGKNPNEAVMRRRIDEIRAVAASLTHSPRVFYVGLLLAICSHIFACVNIVV